MDPSSSEGDFIARGRQTGALGSRGGRAKLFVAEGRETGCNSLRPPAVRGTQKKVSVPVNTLDDFLSRRRIQHVDFIKLDVEGAAQ